jgi:hypothetical protein
MKSLKSAVFVHPNMSTKKNPLASPQFVRPSERPGAFWKAICPPKSTASGALRAPFCPPNRTASDATFGGPRCFRLHFCLWFPLAPSASSCAGIHPLSRGNSVFPSAFLIRLGSKSSLGRRCLPTRAVRGMRDLIAPYFERLKPASRSIIYLGCAVLVLHSGVSEAVVLRTRMIKACCRPDLDV